MHAQKGTKQTHLLARSFKAQSSNHLRDKERKINKSVSVAWTPVEHPEFAGQALSLVIVRDKKGLQLPMYLLTSVVVSTADEAWEMVHSYMHRWGIEQAFRAGKAELGMESPRLWFWPGRRRGKSVEVTGHGGPGVRFPIVHATELASLGSTFSQAVGASNGQSASQSAGADLPIAVGDGERLTGRVRHYSKFGMTHVFVQFFSKNLRS